MGNDPAIASGGPHPGAHGWGFRLELLIERMLVPQAAHQPATGTADLHGVQGKILVLGHPYGDRFEVGEEGGATQITSAGTDATLDPGTVAGGELTQVDTGSQGPGEIAYQRAEVDSMISAEVDGEHAVGLDVVDADDFHGQIVLTDQPLRRDPRLRSAAPGDRVPFEVRRLRHPRENGQPADVLADPLRCPYAFGYLWPGVGRDEDLVSDLR